MSEIAASHVTEYDDGRFIRTAIVAQEKGTSFDLVDENGVRVATINCFIYRGDSGKINHVITDVIDIDENFPKKFAFLFNDGKREFYEAKGNLVCADFRSAEYA